MILLVVIIALTWVAGAVSAVGSLVVSALIDPHLLLITAGSLAAVLFATTMPLSAGRDGR